MDRRTKKRRFVGTNEFIDSSTGEIVGKVNKFRTEAVKSKFIFMYLEDENFYKVLGGMGSSGKVLGYILRVYNDKTGMFYFSSRVKEEMCEELAMSIGTVRSAVKEFADSNIILRVSGAEYMVNPYVFYKGAQEMLPKMRTLFDDMERVDQSRVMNKILDDKAS